MRIRQMDVEAAVDDIKKHTLPAFPTDFAQLIYLSSMRDYNTGEYYHDGLALRFGQEVSGKALATCHREVFDRLVRTSLEGLFQQIESYLNCTGDQQDQLLAAWQQIEPYRVTVPLGADNVSTELFFSNVRILLAILEKRSAKLPPR